MIRYYTHNEIDKKRWDECLLNSDNGMIYGTSWYLDQLNPGWEALVLDDYKLVLPLPIKQKWGFYYLIRPAFCQQLGVFGNLKPDDKIVDEFVKHIPSRFKWIDMPLNEGNQLVGAAFGNNYLLPLTEGYEKLQAAYVQNTKRNIAKARDKNVVAEYSDDMLSLVKLKQQHAFSNVSRRYEDFLLELFEKNKLAGSSKIICCRDKGGNMLAGAMFIRFRNRWIYLLSASSGEGKENRAMFAIIDKFINDQAGKNEILDFEGSMIPELARFFAGFGAKLVSFPRIKANRLPFPLNLIKK